MLHYAQSSRQGRRPTSGKVADATPHVGRFCLADATLTDDELNAIKAQLRARWPEAVGTALPDVLSFASIATTADNTTRVYQGVELAEAPEWAPFLPKAGTYGHPVHGVLDFSPETYARIIDNFKTGRYQDRIPVNAEHDPKASGAVGWITDLRLNADTSIDAQVEWNDRGKALIKGDRFRYVSAELLTQWTDPVSGTQYRDVPTGLAICTNPYFKESVLRPLAASDAVWTLGAHAQKGSRMSEEAPKPASGNEKPTAVQLTEAQVQEFTELKAKADAQAIELAEFKATADRQAIELAEIRKTNRINAFTAEVRGKSDANNRVWFGEADKHVAMLVSLSEAFGDDSEQVKQYVAQNRATAEAMGKSQLFTALGSGGNPEPASAMDKLEAKAVELSEKSGITKEQAFVHVMNTDRELARQLIEERGR